MSNNKIITKLSNLTLATLFTGLAKYATITFLVGSKAMLLSASSIISPMLGILGGKRFSLLYFISQFFLNFLKITLLGYKFILLGYQIPQFFASFYWLSSSRLARSIVPIISIILFIAHPTGYLAWKYATLWLIPILISFFAFDKIFFKALGATFTAHSVGSVLWIYSIPMSPESFISLIPIAIIERILFALGMISVYYFVIFVKSLKGQTIELHSRMIGFNDKAFSNNDGWQ